MCGIGGWIDSERDLTAESGITENMFGELSKRGKNGGGLYLQKEALLFYRTSSEETKQPYVGRAKGESYAAVFCGRLYNKKELRNELECLGYNTPGNTDVELIINCYAQWGKSFVNRLNGFFALAIWKEREKSLFLARDKVGASPLFYYTYNGGIIFASDVGTLMKNPLVKPIIDEDGLNQIFLLGPGRRSGSGIIKGVNEVKPGHTAYFEKNKTVSEQYWKLTAKPFTDSPFEAAKYLRELIADSVRLQSEGKTDIACMLSGGLDSSILSYLVAEEYRKKGVRLTTFSVDYKDSGKYFVKNSFQPDSDNEYIPLMTEHINSRHTGVVLDNADVAFAVKEAAYARGLPGMADIDSSLLLFLREIGKTNKICFSGECSDEFFGGYAWYHNEEMLYSDTFAWLSSSEMRKNLVRNGLIKNGDEYVRELYRKTATQTDYLPSDDLKNRRIREMFNLNFYWFMQTLTDRNDSMSAAAGTETRTPFCDTRIIEYAYNMPYSVKAFKGREKGILREAFKDLLPEDIVWRKKSPYPKSFSPIIYDTAKKNFKRILCDKKSLLSELIDKSYAAELLKQSPADSDRWYGQLMRLPQALGYLAQVDELFKKYNVNLEM